MLRERGSHRMPLSEIGALRHARLGVRPDRARSEKTGLPTMVMGRHRRALPRRLLLIPASSDTIGVEGDCDAAGIRMDAARAWSLRRHSSTLNLTVSS